ncbi:BnaA05g32650D [Brassica napus]|uniref:BnaA05g32650D protein n=1 Tax=Brassica napus TaxID=3708 RepID=A0A078HZX7_BRANA|nr:BnaA05g32650D [Brassica napus]
MEYQLSLPLPTTSRLSFKVHRRKPELVTPAKSTPRELKPLSNIDDQQGLRFQIHFIFFYRRNLRRALLITWTGSRLLVSNLDPVQVIRRALGQTLVYYYPFAGRLWEGPNRKLAVDCTGEGVLVTEADADVTLNEVRFEVCNFGKIYYKYVEPEAVVAGDCLVTRSFFFGREEIAAIRRLLPPGLHNSTFDVLTSFLWRCRTAAMSPDPNTEMRMTYLVDSRSKLRNPPIPSGYYGNVLAMPVAIATAKDLMEKPLEFPLRLIQEAKSSVTEDYIRSVAALMATRDRPKFVTAGNYMVSDLRRFDIGHVDFGPWGKPVYGGPAKTAIGTFPGVSVYMPFKNKKGETGTVVPVNLPALAMKKFIEELNGVFMAGSSAKFKKTINMTIFNAF